MEVIRYILEERALHNNQRDCLDSQISLHVAVKIKKKQSLYLTVKVWAMNLSKYPN
jgi:hypothetical protein